MFRHIAAFEFRYHVRSPVFWVTTLLFGLLTFGAIASDQVQIGSIGNVKKNSPYAIAQTLQVMSLFAVFIMAAFVANVVVRDDETGFAPIVRSTRVSTFDYLFGRFSGAFAAGCLAFAGVPLAMLLGSFMPWIDPERLGPTRLADYLYVYVILCVPTLLVMGAFCFALATMTRSMVSTYVGLVGLLMIYFVSTAYFTQPEYEWIVALVEPFGLGAVSTVTKYWTAAERNLQLPAMTGVLLWNRTIWLSAGFALLGATWLLFRRARTGATKAGQRPTAETPTPTDVRGVAALPAPRRDAATSRAQLLALARFDMAAVFRSPAFFVLLGMGFLNAFGGLWFAEDMYGNRLHPVTRIMIQALAGAFTLIPLIVSIYYAGELVWRVREQRLHEVIDATPAPDWAHVVPKVVAIALVLVATVAVSVLAGVTVQLFRGHTNVELGKYLGWYVVPQSFDAVRMAVLAVFVQVVVPHKFIGWLVMLVIVVAQTVLAQLGYEHRLYEYAGFSILPLSDLNGEGHVAASRNWLQIYWGAFAIMLVVFAYGLWPRGVAAPLMVRLARVPRRLSGTPMIVLAGALVLFVGAGGYFYYNTNVLNAYRTEIDNDRWTADFEKTLLPFEHVPQPRIVDVELTVDLHPRQLRAETTGRYTLENRHGSALGEVHVRWDRDTTMRQLAIPGTRLAREYPEFNYRVYAFEPPLPAGGRVDLTFETTRGQRGFRNRRNQTDIVFNGTFVDNSVIAPMLGIWRDFVLRDRAKRRKYGLPPELRLPKLEDESARVSHYLRPDSDWVTATVTVSTDADQQAIAPGERVSEAVADGRRTVRFRTDTPIMHFFSIQSASYAVAQDRWRDVDLAVYYHPTHDYNVDRMITAMKGSLDYFTEHFSAFQFKQLRILEFPAYRTFAQSFANTIPYSEAIGFIASYDEPDKIDLVTYVTAHEVGHQWWGHQVMGAGMQGMTLLVETLAQYSALMVMEQLNGPHQIRKFLKFELDNYLRSRGGELIEELPLERVEDQSYIHYQKGSVAMYLLKDSIGADAVNRALRGLLSEFAFKAAPYPTSRDLIRHLRAQAPPEHQALITDLFERITLYDAKVIKAVKSRRADGQWDVTIDVDARKLYADGEGRETEATLDEPFDIGVFTAEPGRKGFDDRAVVLFERRPLRSGAQQMRLTVPVEPTFVGVDPYNKWIDRNSEDNVRGVDAEGG